MDRINIYRGTELIHSTPINEGAERRFTLMKEDVVHFSYNDAKPILFKQGDTVEYEKKIFVLLEDVKPLYNDTTGGYGHELTFHATYYEWKNKIFRYAPNNAAAELSFNLTDTLDKHLSLIVANVKAQFGKDYTYSIGGNVATDAKVLSYNNVSILEALNLLAEAWKCEWWVFDNIVHFGRLEIGTAIPLELHTNAVGVDRTDSNNIKANRFYVFGGTRNIPHNYRETSSTDVVNAIVQKRLMLPVGTDFIGKKGDKGIIESVLIFDDVYPHKVSELQDVQTKEYTDEVEQPDGTIIQEKWNAYTFLEKNGTFKEEYMLSGEPLMVVFQSGRLAGMQLEVLFSDKDKRFEILRNEEYGRLLPDDTLHPQDGDKFILYGFNIQLVSDEYIPQAEKELQQVAEKYIANINYTNYRVRMIADAESQRLDIGQVVEVKDTQYDAGSVISRIIGYSHALDYPFNELVYQVGETANIGRIEALEQRLDETIYKTATYSIAGGGMSAYIITSRDTTRATDYNLFSAKRIQKNYLSKTRPDTADGKITFKDGILIGEFAEDVSGGKIDKYGVAELKSLKLNSFLNVPELRYNRTTFRIGNEWQGRGGGIIERVEVLNETRGIIHLKLEKGELSSIEKDDICQGIFHQKSNNSTITSDDSRGNFLFAGFSTSYFRVVSKLENTAFLYELRPKSDRWKSLHHPSEGMHFACYGNFSDKERQSSCYTTPTYQRYLTRVNDWEFGVANIAAQFGDLSNLTIHGLNMQGYSAYLNNIYMSGTIEQLEELPIFIEISTDGYNSLRYGERLKVTCKVFKGFKDVTEAIDSWDIKRSENEYDPWLSSEKVRNFKAQKNVEENILFISNGYKTESGKIENDLLESDRTTFTITAKTETQTLKYELMI